MIFCICMASWSWNWETVCLSCLADRPGGLTVNLQIDIIPQHLAPTFDLERSMKLWRMFGGLALAMLAVSCAAAQQIPTPLPTMTEVVALPSATPTALPTPTFTPIPPTETSTLTATATATSVPTIRPTPPAFLLTQDLPAIPVGKGALIVTNHYGQDELDLDIDGKVYKIPGSGRMVIFLSPGHYTFSASVAGHAGRSGATQILENYYLPQDYGQ